MLARLGMLAGRGGRAVVLLGFALVSGGFHALPPRAPAGFRGPEHSGVPITFVENRGQLPGGSDLYLLGADITVEFGSGGLVCRQGPSRSEKPAARRNGRLDDGEPWPASHGLEVRFVGGSGVHPTAEDLRTMRVNSFSGAPDRWRTGCKTYGRVRYRDVWPGIDLVYSAGVGVLKHEFVVRPGADPSRIRLAWLGALGHSLGADGALLVRAGGGTLRDEPPFSYQDVEDRRVEVPTRYAISDSKSAALEYGFHVAEYDRTRTLVIDPAQIVYATYVGGPYQDSAQDVAVDAQGSAYVTGGIGNPSNNSVDAYVLKVAPDGESMLELTTLGGDQPDEGLGVAVDAKGAAYVTGIAASRDFPSLGGPSTKFGGGVSDAFVAKIGSEGNLVYCGFIGGAKRDYGADIAVDAAGNAYVAGPTRSPQSSFPVTVGPDLTYNGGYDLFVAKVAPDGSKLLYAGYVGGDGEDANAQQDGEVVAGDLALDSKGCVYLCGSTNSTEKTFPNGNGFGSLPSWDSKFNGSRDAFAVKVKADGTGLAWAGYVGGDGIDHAQGIAVDEKGDAFLAGEVASGETTFPTGSGFGDLPGLNKTYGGNIDAFAVKIRADGTKLLWATYLGGGEGEKAICAAVDRAGDLHVVGNAMSSRLPTSNATFNPTPGGNNDAFLLRLSGDGTTILSSGYLGGDNRDLGYGVAVDPAGDSYVVGITMSSEATFPSSGGMASRKGKGRTFLGVSDGFLVKVSK